MAEEVRFEMLGPVARITLNRPEKLNALNGVMIAALHDALDRAEAEPSARCVVLHGEGRAFCSGFELGASGWPDTVPGVRALLKRDFDIIMRFWDSPLPTVAAVHGYCLGGGFELALACDITVAAESCRFGEPEPRFGSGIVALLLPWVTGPKQAKRMLFTGDDRIDARRAQGFGLLTDVVEDGTHLDAALALAREIAVNDPQAVALTKQAIARSYDIMGMRQALLQAMEIDVLIETTETPESREFNEVLRREGARAAIAWRRARLSEGD